MLDETELLNHHLVLREDGVGSHCEWCGFWFHSDKPNSPEFDGCCDEREYFDQFVIFPLIEGDA